MYLQASYMISGTCINTPEKKVKKQEKKQYWQSVDNVEARR